MRGEGGVVLLAGEAGIGKTRLAEELAAAGRERGALVLWGRCHEGDPGTPGQSGAPAYWPLVQIIRGYLQQADADAIAAVMGPGATDIAQVVPEVALRLPDRPEPPNLEPEQARFRLFDSVTSFFPRAAAARPLLLILDDLQWADVPSLLLLRFLAREMPPSRLLVVGTYRDEEVDQRPLLVQTIAQLARESSVTRT